MLEEKNIKTTAKLHKNMLKLIKLPLDLLATKNRFVYSLKS